MAGTHALTQPPPCQEEKARKASRRLSILHQSVSLSLDFFFVLFVFGAALREAVGEAGRARSGHQRQASLTPG